MACGPRATGCASAAGTGGGRCGSGRQTAEPLIRLDDFRFHAPLRYAPGKPIHISVVELKGLSVDMPPKSHFGLGDATAPAPLLPASPRSAMAAIVSFDVDTMEVTGAELVMETNKPGKLPLDFQIARIKLTDIAAGGAMGFDAELTNPRPKGTIKTTGSFGPWRTADPGESPLSGDYHLDHADLATSRRLRGFSTQPGIIKERCAT